MITLKFFYVNNFFPKLCYLLISATMAIYYLNVILRMYYTQNDPIKLILQYVAVALIDINISFYYKIHL